MVMMLDLPAGIALRPITPDDHVFLRQLYTVNRWEELAPTGWADEQKRAFLLMQFNAQHRHYLEHYPGAVFGLIMANDIPVGRLYTDTWQHEIRIMDITLLPEYRHQGIGTAILKQLMSQAAKACKALGIHVERFNPALRLYERLGFVQAEDKGVYFFMLWTPESD